MDPTGETQNNPSDFAVVELYGGPLDGEEYLLPQFAVDHTNSLEIIRPCNHLIREKAGLPNTNIPCSHLYIRRKTDSLRFIFHSTSLL